VGGVHPGWRLDVGVGTAYQVGCHYLARVLYG